MLSDGKSGICHGMAPLRMSYIMTLTYIFKVTKFEMRISWKRWELTKNAQVWLLWKLVLVIKWDHCKYFPIWSWPKFSRSNFSNDYFDKTGKLQTLPLQSDRKSGIYHRTTPLRILYIMTSIYICKVTNFEMWISRKRWELADYHFHRGFWKSNGIIASVMFHNLVLHFQDQTFSCYKKYEVVRCPRQIAAKVTFIFVVILILWWWDGCRWFIRVYRTFVDNNYKQDWLLFVWEMQIMEQYYIYI